MFLRDAGNLRRGQCSISTDPALARAPLACRPTPACARRSFADLRVSLVSTQGWREVEVFGERREAGAFIAEISAMTGVAVYLRGRSVNSRRADGPRPPASLHISSVRAPRLRRSRRCDRSIP